MDYFAALAMTRK